MLPCLLSDSCARVLGKMCVNVSMLLDVCLCCVRVGGSQRRVRLRLLLCCSYHHPPHGFDCRSSVRRYLLNSLFCTDCLTGCSLPNFPPPGLCHASRWQSHFFCSTGPTQREYYFKCLFVVVDGCVSMPVTATQHEVPRCRPCWQRSNSLAMQAAVLLVHARLDWESCCKASCH